MNNELQLNMSMGFITSMNKELNHEFDRVLLIGMFVQQHVKTR